MESGISRLDCYEDMFKEITKKLYGEDLDHRTSSVQNEFETSVSYKNDEDTGNGTDGSDEGNWTCEEEPLKGTDGSRIAAYHPSKATWRCYECGDVMAGGPREAAEHFMELHSSRILADDNRHRHHSPRKDYLQTELKVDDVVTYLERLRERAERAAPPTRRTQETQTLPATLLPVTPSFLLQELTPTPQQSPHLYQTTSPPSTSTAPTSPPQKRYNCQYCPYGTDRRDLFVRHENIHREDKPFQCYECNKQFNRADHVKKHFGRMHRESTYDVSKIRRPPEQRQMTQEMIEAPGPSNIINGPQQQHATTFQYANNRGYQSIPGTSNNTAIYQSPAVPNVNSGISQPEPSTSRRGPNSGCHSKSHTKTGSKNATERRFICPQCQWTGSDNWCLKRHLNTHTKPYQCTMCDYKAARAERLATHMARVHAKKQCTRCGLLCENDDELEMHQAQAHRMSGGTSASRTTPSTSRTMMQQPLLPPGGGRPPPGPPVFPAPAQPIPQATSVMSPSTLVGHEMVKSPATATTMAYPTEEEKRSYRRAGGVNGDDGVNHDDAEHADDNDDDNDGVVRSNGNREERSRNFGSCRVCSFKSYRDFESCSDHSNRCTKDDVTDMSNRPMKLIWEMLMNRDTTIRIINDSETPTENGVQYPADMKNPEEQKPELKPELKPDLKLVLKLEQKPELKPDVQLPSTSGLATRKKRSRKQLHPRKIEEEDANSDESDDEYWKSLSSEFKRHKSYRQVKIKIRNVLSKKASSRLFRCILCPRHAAARGIINEGHRPYHTRASLLLHKFWRHRRRKKPSQSPMSTINVSSLISSITLKAIFVARPNYNYYR